MERKNSAFRIIYFRTADGYEITPSLPIFFCLSISLSRHVIEELKVNPFAKDLKFWQSPKVGGYKEIKKDFFLRKDSNDRLILTEKGGIPRDNTYIGQPVVYYQRMSAEHQ